MKSSEKPVSRPDSRWLRDARWGFFTHFLAHMASDPASVMSREKWIRKVDSLDAKKLAAQLADLKTPYFFITIGQHRMHYCAPNKTFDDYFGKDTGVRTERDLIADIARELSARNIRMCVYINTYGFQHADGINRNDSGGRDCWIEVLREWSERWGSSVSAWWLDGGGKVPLPVYRKYFDAMKSGNKDALVATKLWWHFPTPEVLEDYTDGESGFLLQVDAMHFQRARPGVTDKLPLHFLSFLGEFWGIGEPRFPVEVVTGWTRHINNLGGTVSWDCPVTDEGMIPEKVYDQLAVLSKDVSKR